MQVERKVRVGENPCPREGCEKELTHGCTQKVLIQHAPESQGARSEAWGLCAEGFTGP